MKKLNVVGFGKKSNVYPRLKDALMSIASDSSDLVFDSSNVNRILDLDGFNTRMAEVEPLLEIYWSEALRDMDDTSITVYGFPCCDDNILEQCAEIERILKILQAYRISYTMRSYKNLDWLHNFFEPFLKDGKWDYENDPVGKILNLQKVESCLTAHYNETLAAEYITKFKQIVCEIGAGYIVNGVMYLNTLYKKPGGELRQVYNWTLGKMLYAYEYFCVESEDPDEQDAEESFNEIYGQES